MTRLLPDEWFRDPGFTTPTRLHVTPDGRMLGHIATWWTRHKHLTNGPFPVYPPRSPDGSLAFFHTGAVRTASGRYVRTGGITLDGLHPRSADSPLSAAAYYDRTASTVADLVAGQDAEGIWVTGALRPGLTARQLARVRTWEPSGDWRVVGGALELVGICMTDNPGFPVRPRPHTVTAAGTASPAARRQARTELDKITRHLDALEDAKRDRLVRAATARVGALLDANRDRRIQAMEERLSDLRVAALDQRMTVLERRRRA